jgi:hypothetical protein
LNDRMALSLLAEVMGWPEDDQAIATHEYAYVFGSSDCDVKRLSFSNTRSHSLASTDSRAVQSGTALYGDPRGEATPLKRRVELDT